MLVCSPEMEAPYSSEEEKMRLLDLYRYMHGRMHSTSRPLKLIYHVAERETLLAWVRDCCQYSAEPITTSSDWLFSCCYARPPLGLNVNFHSVQALLLQGSIFTL